MRLSEVTSLARSNERDAFVAKIGAVPALVPVAKPEDAEAAGFSTPPRGTPLPKSGKVLADDATPREETSWAEKTHSGDDERGTGADTWFLKQAAIVEAARALKDPEVVFLKKSSRNPFLDMITLGRSPNNDIVIAHPTISKIHAHFVRKAAIWWVVDTASRNGTFVGATRVSPAGVPLLRDGVEIRFGSGFVFNFYGPAGFFASLVGWPTGGGRTFS